MDGTLGPEKLWVSRAGAGVGLLAGQMIDHPPEAARSVCGARTCRVSCSPEGKEHTGLLGFPQGLPGARCEVAGGPLSGPVALAGSTRSPPSRTLTPSQAVTKLGKPLPPPCPSAERAPHGAHVKEEMLIGVSLLVVEPILKGAFGAERR